MCRSQGFIGKPFSEIIAKPVHWKFLYLEAKALGMGMNAQPPQTLTSVNISSTQHLSKLLLYLLYSRGDHLAIHQLFNEGLYPACCRRLCKEISKTVRLEKCLSDTQDAEWEPGPPCASSPSGIDRHRGDIGGGAWFHFRDI